MSKSAGNAITLLLSIVGCIIASALAYAHWHSDLFSGCVSSHGGCTAALNCVYGQTGSVPTSIAGVGMYTVLMCFCFARRCLLQSDTRDLPRIGGICLDIRGNPHLARKGLRLINLAICSIACVGSGISVWFQEIAIYDLQSFCPLCIGSAFIITIIAVMSSSDALLGNRRLTGEQRYLLAAVVLIASFGVLLFGPDTILKQIHQDIPLMPDRVASEPADSPGIQSTSEVIPTDLHYLGCSNAKYTIVVFLDYQCPHCKLAVDMIHDAIKRSPTRYRFGIRHYPLPMHHWASAAACAAEAAARQGKFWKMSSYMLARQSEMSGSTFNKDTFIKYASALGLNLGKFEADELCNDTTTRVARDGNTARAMKMQMIPTFFVRNQHNGLYQLTGMEPMKAALNNPNDKAWQ